MFSGNPYITPAEFIYASEGNVAALRTWLQSNRERVNLPNPNTRHTLLYTATCADRGSVVAMLVTEFNADISVPCGAIDNTCLHVAAEHCNEDILSFLLSFGIPPKRNALNQLPLDLARQQLGRHPSAQNCIVMLQMVEEQPDKQGLTSATETFNPFMSITQPVSSADQLRPSAYQSPMSGGEFNYSDLLEREKQWLGVDSVAASSPGGLPSAQRVKKWYEGMPRDTRHLDRSKPLPYDLQELRRAYKGVFKFYETCQNYRAQGMLPYKYNGEMYYTPVILIVTKTHAGDRYKSGSESGVNPSTSDKDRTALTSSCVLDNSSGVRSSPYRALIDIKALAGLSINRRATYIDPRSGAIIPSSADAKVRSLVQYVSDVILANFSLIAPLTRSNDSTKVVNNSGPLFYPFSHRREITTRVLRALSQFCDNAFTYDAVTCTAEGHLPITKVSPFSSASVDLHEPTVTSGGISKAAPLDLLEGDVVMKLPLRIKFDPNGDFTDVPRLYFPTALDSSPERRALQPIIEDSTNGKLDLRNFTSIQDWSTHGSLQAVLKEVQEKATDLIVKYCKENPGPAHSASGSGGSFEPSENSAVTPALSPIAAGSGSSQHVRAHGHSTAETHVKERELSTKCVTCLDAEKDVLLLPCRHLALCSTCSVTYIERQMDGMLCPICRVVVEQAMQIYT